MVRIITSLSNREILQQSLPEAMVTAYDSGKWQGDEPDEQFIEAFIAALAWADCILIGPGIGTSKQAKWLLNNCLQRSTLPMVIDADGLNLLAEGNKTVNDRNIILTPHLGEFARLYGCSVAEAKANMLSYPKYLAEKMKCTVVCKDARTIVAVPDGKTQYVNMSGNSGMATAGSGDVLAGVITGLLAQGMETEQAAVNGVYLHGVAGDMAAASLGEHSMMATDIIEQLTGLLRKKEEA